MGRMGLWCRALVPVPDWAVTYPSHHEKNDLIDL